MRCSGCQAGTHKEAAQQPARAGLRACLVNCAVLWCPYHPPLPGCWPAAHPQPPQANATVSPGAAAAAALNASTAAAGAGAAAGGAKADAGSSLDALDALHQHLAKVTTTTGGAAAAKTATGAAAAGAGAATAKGAAADGKPAVGRHVVDAAGVPLVDEEDEDSIHAA